jgi:hypothetical protein
MFLVTCFVVITFVEVVGWFLNTEKELCLQQNKNETDIWTEIQSEALKTQ